MFFWTWAMKTCIIFSKQQYDGPHLWHWHISSAHFWTNLTAGPRFLVKITERLTPESTSHLMPCQGSPTMWPTQGALNYQDPHMSCCPETVIWIMQLVFSTDISDGLPLPSANVYTFQSWNTVIATKVAVAHFYGIRFHISIAIAHH